MLRRLRTKGENELLEEKVSRKKAHGKSLFMSGRNRFDRYAHLLGRSTEGKKRLKKTGGDLEGK